MHKNRLLGLVFYEGKLTGSRYLELLEDAISDFVDDLPLSDLRNLWFQHDGASQHKVLSVQQHLWDLHQHCRNFETVLRMLMPACHLTCYTMCSKKSSSVSRCILLMRDTILSMTDRWTSFPASAVCDQICKCNAIKQICVLWFLFVSFLCARCSLVENHWCWASLQLTFSPYLVPFLR